MTMHSRSAERVPRNWQIRLSRASRTLEDSIEWFMDHAYLDPSPFGSVSRDGRHVRLSNDVPVAGTVICNPEYLCHSEIIVLGAVFILVLADKNDAPTATRRSSLSSSVFYCVWQFGVAEQMMLS